MIFQETPLAGAFLLDAELRRDDRGFFARTFCIDEFAAHGLSPRVVQCNVSYNRSRGTLRGMHYQAAPHAECKLVRCTRGAIFDVIVDLRPASPTFKRWFGTELTEVNRRSLFVPEGMAHGFQTLADDTEVFYQMSDRFVAGLARGVRWDDPAFGIVWPQPPVALSDKDRGYPDFDPSIDPPG